MGRQMTLHYSAIVVKEKGAFWAYVADLPGVYGTGKTAVAARKDLTEALKLFIEDCQADGDPVPRSTAKVVGVSDLVVTA